MSTSLAGYRVVSPAPRDVWHYLLTVDPEALPDQTPDWTDAICAGGRFADASRLYELPSGQRMILPMVRRTGVLVPLTLALEASMPSAWGMGGVLTQQSPDIADIAVVCHDLANRPRLRTVVRPNPRHGDLWTAASASVTVTTVPRCAHVLDLSGGFEQVWQSRFRAGTRTQVRKAERSDLVVEGDVTGKLVPEFIQLYRRSVARWARRQGEPLALARWRASRRDPPDKLRRIAETMGVRCQIWLARLGEEPVAGIIVLRDPNAHYTRGAMNEEIAGSSNANYLLLKHAIADACSTGAAYFHMGESGTSSSLAFFKERFGAIAYRYLEYRFEKLPITAVDRTVRSGVKRIVGFEDAT